MPQAPEPEAAGRSPDTLGPPGQELIKNIFKLL
jgi:hypothetical protein